MKLFSLTNFTIVQSFLIPETGHKGLKTRSKFFALGLFDQKSLHSSPEDAQLTPFFTTRSVSNDSSQYTVKSHSVIFGTTESVR